MSVGLCSDKRVLLQVEPGGQLESQPDFRVICITWGLLLQQTVKFALDVNRSVATANQVPPDSWGHAERMLYRLLVRLPGVKDAELEQFSVVLHKEPPFPIWRPERFDAVAMCFKEALGWDPIIEVTYRRVPKQ